MWHVLTAGPLGSYWDGPYTQEALRKATAAGRLPGDVAVRSPDGRIMSVRAAFTPRQSPWGTLGKLALAGVGIYAGAKLAEAVGQHLSDTAEQRSIRRSAREHEASGAEVCADHIGWRCTPPLFGRRRPDVYADYGTHVVIEEHETEASVDRRHSIEQDRDLRRSASRRPRVNYRQIVS